MSFLGKALSIKGEGFLLFLLLDFVSRIVGKVQNLGLCMALFCTKPQTDSDTALT